MEGRDLKIQNIGSNVKIMKTYGTSQIICNVIFYDAPVVRNRWNCFHLSTTMTKIAIMFSFIG